MRAIQALKKELNEGKRSDVINVIEELIADDMTKATKDKTFFSLPLNNILNIVSQIIMEKQDDPVSLIKTIITRTIEAHSKEKETLFLLHSLKTDEIDLTVQQCVDILSLFTPVDIFVQLHQKFKEYSELTDVDSDSVFTEQQKEIERLKEELMKHGTFQSRIQEPDDFESDIFLAVKKGKLSSIMYIIENEKNNTNKKAEKDYNEEMLLHFACKYGHLQIVQYLIFNKTNIEAKNKNGETPLHVACSHGYLPIVKFLIQHGAKIEATPENKWTPLHYACYNGSLSVVKYLVERGANIEAKDEYGKTPLYRAAFYDRTNVIKYLLSKGANINAKTYGSEISVSDIISVPKN